MRFVNKRVSLTALLCALLVATAGAMAQEKPQQTNTADKTGTNPINFQNDVRIYNEYSELNTAGDGNQNVTTVEFRTPFMDGKWQYRARVRYNDLSADFNNDGIDEVDQTGFGDTDMRFLTVPYLNAKRKQAFAYALEVFFDTASDAALGSGTTALGPQAFFVQFFKGGLGPYKGGGLFAPGLQYKFSIDEDEGRAETDQILIDLNLLVMGTSKQFWFFTDPQIVFDRETRKEFAIIDLEFGWMMTNWFPDLKGHSFYIRPAFGVGHDRPTDYAVEIGYKLVGW